METPRGSWNQSKDNRQKTTETWWLQTVEKEFEVPKQNRQGYEKQEWDTGRDDDDYEIIRGLGLKVSKKEWAISTCENMTPGLSLDLR